MSHTLYLALLGVLGLESIHKSRKDRGTRSKERLAISCKAKYFRGGSYRFFRQKGTNLLRHEREGYFYLTKEVW